MSKFGELVDGNAPLLLVFFEELEELKEEFNHTLRDVAAAIGDHGKVIKINIAKNPKLVNALRVKAMPTLMIYKLGEMVWRQSGEQDANTLIALMNEYVH